MGDFTATIAEYYRTNIIGRLSPNDRHNYETAVKTIRARLAGLRVDFAAVDSDDIIFLIVEAKRYASPSWRPSTGLSRASDLSVAEDALQSAYWQIARSGWFAPVGGSRYAPEAEAPAVVSLRFIGQRQFQDYQASLLKLIDVLIVSLLRMLVGMLAALAHLAAVPTFLYVTISSIRHYGHRGEPDHLLLPLALTQAQQHGTVRLAA